VTGSRIEVFTSSGARVSCLVTLRAEVDRSGHVRAVRILRGHPLFDDAAVEAVKGVAVLASRRGRDSCPLRVDCEDGFLLTPAFHGL
jgi:TonB family protein